jgi:broad specificity phosphatase PhoE
MALCAPLAVGLRPGMRVLLVLPRRVRVECCAPQGGGVPIRAGGHTRGGESARRALSRTAGSPHLGKSKLHRQAFGWPARPSMSSSHPPSPAPSGLLSSPWPATPTTAQWRVMAELTEYLVDLCDVGHRQPFPHSPRNAQNFCFSTTTSMNLFHYPAGGPGRQSAAVCCRTMSTQHLTLETSRRPVLFPRIKPRCANPCQGCLVESPPDVLQRDFGPPWDFAHLPQHWWPGGLPRDATLERLCRQDGTGEEPHDAFTRRVESFFAFLRGCPYDNLVVFGHGDFFNQLTKSTSHDGPQREEGGAWLENGEVYTYH